MSSVFVRTERSVVHWVGHEDLPYSRIESLVTQCYVEAYGARAPLYAKTFLLWESLDAAEERACLSVTPAGASPLFAEQFMSGASEAAIARGEGTIVSRSDVVELGTFAATDPGAGVELLEIAPQAVLSRGFRYALMTAIPAARRLMEALGMTFHALAPARPEALPNGQAAHWGSYFLEAPVTGYIVLGELALSPLPISP